MVNICNIYTDLCFPYCIKLKISLFLTCKLLKANTDKHYINNKITETMSLFNNIKLTSFAFIFSLLIFIQPSASAQQMAQNLDESLVGSVWRYEDDDLMYEIEFTEGGMLISSHPHDITPGNDSWKQQAQFITFSYNNQFSVYEGKMVSEDLIVGKASNRSFSWEWKAYRISEKKDKKVLALN
jgi:hypothetical protein